MFYIADIPKYRAVRYQYLFYLFTGQCIYKYDQCCGSELVLMRIRIQIKGFDDINLEKINS
jgi:hypothetical protein